MMQYFESLRIRVEQKLSDFFYDRFALIFYGLSTVDTHYICIVASYSTTNKNGY